MSSTPDSNASGAPSAELARLAEADLLRTLKPLDSAAGPRVIRAGHELHNFASNDYLGLANHAAVTAAFSEGLGRFGAGSAAARLVCGTLPPHVALEEDLAAAKDTEAALVFSSGFATALGCIPAIVDSGDTVILDKLCHASLIDAARLSGATLRVFPHNDVSKLRKLLSTLRAKGTPGRILILTESVFSMDGDLCPLEEITELCGEFEALLWLDEAHAFGVLGSTGMGLAQASGQQDRVTFQMGTFSKAAGLSGGYVAASRPWIDLLVNRARSFIYSTAPPPALAHATRTSLALIQSQDGSALRDRLRENIAALSASAASPIVPVILGGNEAALNASAALEHEGFLVPAIRYPTVPRGTARLRISLSAAHEVMTIQALSVRLAGLAPGQSC